MSEGANEVGKGLLEGIIEALSDRHSQVDLRLQNLTLTLGDSRLALRLTGTVTVAVHMRELTEDERTAHIAANLAKIQSAG